MSAVKTRKRRKKIEDSFIPNVTKSEQRTKKTAEIFTPTELVKEIHDKLEEDDKTIFQPSAITFLDPACGDGAFLVDIKRRLLLHGDTEKNALGRIYGVDLMADNCCDAIYRLLRTDNNGTLEDPTLKRTVYGSDSNKLLPFETPEGSWVLDIA